MASACSTTRSKDDNKGIKALYHNTTSKYNAYFNAQELMAETMLDLEEMQDNNYNKILPVFEYVDISNPTAIAPKVDKAIEKVITVATIHEFSNYVDDCYVLMAKAQYLKQDYAAAEETLQFFEEEFDPKNPYGREYRKAKLKKKSSKERSKEQKQKRKEADEERKEADKEREEQRKREKKKREAEQKEREKKAKERRKKGRTSRSSYKKNKTEDKAVDIAADARKAQKEEAEKKRKEEEAYDKKKEELKKEEEEKKNKTERPQGEGAIFKNKTAYYEGLYWLARTYTETERYSAAKYIFDRLNGTSPLDENLANKIPAAQAHLMMKSGEEEDALIYLETAIAKEKDKNLKARYAFIRGQLFEQTGNSTMAYQEYKNARKLSPNYELKFNAELNELKLSYKNGQITKEKAFARLEKMNGEAKNDPFSDQLFFTMADVKLNSGDVDGAIADFESSIASAGGSPNVKLEAYYKLAELLFEKGLYKKAKDNYDNALKLMALTDERYRTVERLSKSLTEIANNIEIVELNDSLMRLTKMSDSDLRAFAREELEEQKAVAAEKTDSPDVPKRNVFASSGGNNSQLGSGRSNFFAYNPISLNQGKAEFTKNWGSTRKIEDNWRRSLRTDVSISDDDDSTEKEEVSVTDKDINEFLRDVPRSPAQKESIQNETEMALFALGIQFRDRLRNYEKSIAALDRLVKEFPKYKKRDEALYYLYLNHMDMDNFVTAEQVKKQLAADYPDSKFTELAMNPGMSNSTLAKKTIAVFYEKTYELFQKRKYDIVLDRIDEKGKIYDENEEFDPKFDLLGAMSHGSIEGKERYVKELEQLIRRHKNTPEEVRAKEILRFLKGDSEAFDEILFEEDEASFSLDNDQLHYVFVVVYEKSQMELQDIKIAISDYNKEYHRRDNLKISNITLDPTKRSHIILIRSFENSEKAMAYYDGSEKNKDIFIQRSTKRQAGATVGYDIFAATQKNYREVVKQRSTAKYRQFFESTYLKR